MPGLPFTPGVAGVDEAGRGPIAGPLVVAAVLLPEGFPTDGITDSKALTESKREAAFTRIVEGTIHHIEVVPVEVVDQKNILRATLEAMSHCLRQINATQALIDGNQLPKDLPCPAKTIVKGDSRDAAIAAASILAKVTRDHIMVDLHNEFPTYNFHQNKGYGTDAIALLRAHGPTPHHRRSFEPLKSMESQPCLIFEN